MSNIELYGIANCDTVKKVRKWLEGQGLNYAFHDYKIEGADPVKLGRWAQVAGWEALLNRRGTTFRKLSDAKKVDIDEAKAIRLMAQYPSMIKRPVAEHSGGLLVGFDEVEWTRALTHA